MKIVTKRSDGEPDIEYDNFELVATDDQGKSMRFSIGGGEPEDMSLSRELSGALTVPQLMQMAHEAGKRGETFELVETTDARDG